MHSTGLPIEVLLDSVAVELQGDFTIPARKNILIEPHKQLLDWMTGMQKTLDILNY